MTAQPTETEPLIVTAEQPADVYARFSPARKRVILGISSFSGLVPLFVSGCFIPCIPQIAKDLDATPEVIGLSISISILSVGIGSLFWATYSGFYGRRPIYLFSIPVHIFGSLGVTLCRTPDQLLFWRATQAVGVSAGFSVGSATIGDIYSLTERGTALGIFYGFALVGPALAPLAGGLAARYGSWRDMQVALVIAGIVAFAAMYLWLPETAHPGTRGVDKLEAKHPSKKPGLVWLNPIGSLWLLRNPALLFVATAGMLSLITDFMLMIPIAYTVGKRYGVTNEAAIGAFFIPMGLGNLIGAPLSGRMSDAAIVRLRAARGGVWVPEDRLRLTLLGALIFCPLSILLSGLVIQYVKNDRLGIGLNLFLFFCNGLGVDFVLSPSAAYIVDVLPTKSAEGMASNNSFRAILNAGATTLILPMVNLLGVVTTDIIGAILGWIGFLLLWLTIRYGDRMRRAVDVGFVQVE